jgi:uroporphyrinogen-III decarboxylase
MKTTVYFSDFCDAFRKHSRDDNFSYDGKRVLFEYLQDLEDSTGEEIELDVIAFCCEYDENHIDDIINNYSIDVEGLDDDEKIEAVREYLQENTCLVGDVPGGFIYAAF